MEGLFKSKKGTGFVFQFSYYIICLIILWVVPGLRESSILSFMGTAGICLASYHVTQGVIDWQRTKTEAK